MLTYMPSYMPSLSRPQTARLIPGLCISSSHMIVPPPPLLSNRCNCSQDSLVVLAYMPSIICMPSLLHPQTAWTSAEDSQLLALHQEHGNSWSTISRCMAGRTPQQCRMRYFQLKGKGPEADNTTRTKVSSKSNLGGDRT
jgi:hypothetical protein